MNTNSTACKINVGVTLLVLFVITLVSGVVLHLKSHGIIVEPRKVIKIVHWVSGFLMTAFVLWHGKQFWRAFVSQLKQPRLSGINTAILIGFVVFVALTGLVKLVSPVKIHGLGLWHYWLGMIMAVVAIFHLFKGFPMLIKMIKSGSRKKAA